MHIERVIDGDTFVANGKKIRLWGIDAPERKEVGYISSGWFLESLLEQHNVECFSMYTDKYERYVMRCFSDGLDIGATMVLFGMAKDYKKYSDGFYEEEQSNAISQKKGIWGRKK